MTGPAREQLNRTAPSSLVLGYMDLRKTVGWLGTLLPAVLLAGNLIFPAAVRLPGLPESMSYYYYTPMRNILVATLCALGVFLLSYLGHDRPDFWITTVAGLGAIGTALFPTKPAVCLPKPAVCAPPALARLTTQQTVIGDIHLTLAMIMFLALGVMALRFTRSGPGALTPEKKKKKKLRNDIYRVCGIAIFVLVGLSIAANFVIPPSVTATVPVLYILEALAVIAFGVSWFVKGQTLLPVLKVD